MTLVAQEADYFPNLHLLTFLLLQAFVSIFRLFSCMAFEFFGFLEAKLFQKV